jgi:transposase InsO family protein
MPWQEKPVMDQREDFVRLALAPGSKVAELCRRFGISRANAYKWLARYREEGREGLCDRSRRPRCSPARWPQPTEAEVLRIRDDSNNAWGARKIAKVMERSDPLGVPALSTITEILRRHGRLDRHSQEHPGPFQRFERAHPNELWQMDFKGHFPMAEGRCHPLTVLDDHSRYSLTIGACGNEQHATVCARLVPVFRCYGLPFAMLMDNGAPWGDAGRQPHTIFTAWLMRRDIRVIHSRPYHPQTQGKEERFHRSFKAEVLNGNSFRDLDDCQRAFDRWRPIYNHERPHEALAMATPAERYRASPRSFPETLPPIEYGPDDIVRKANVNGDISLKGRRLSVGKPFRGQPVGLRPTTEDGVFSIYYCAHQIGRFDLRMPPSQPQSISTEQDA